MSKKAQEEMMGFVLIVILVSIAGVIFLGIFLRSGGDEDIGQKSSKLYSLIGGLSQITTSCEIPQSNLINVRDLIRECINGNVCTACQGETCGNTDGACEVLENTLKKAMESSYVVTDKSYTKYYNLSIYYEFDGKNIISPILVGSQGNCLGNKLSNNRPFDDQGEKVIMSLEICFRED